MAKQIINVGTTANDKQGDSLRAAFQKVNTNFTELYTALGLNADENLNLGSFEFNGSEITTTDSSSITIQQQVNITSDLVMSGDVVPSATDIYDLGSLEKQWRSLYLKNNTIYFDGVPLSVTNDGTIIVNGEVAATPGGATTWDSITSKPEFAAVATSGSYDDLTDTPAIPSITGLATETYVDDAVGAITVPVDISDLTDTENLLTNVNTGDFTFNGNILSTDVGMSLELNSGSLDISIDEYLWQFTDSGTLSFPGSTASIYGDANTLELFADTNSNNGIGVSSSETRVINSGSVRIISDTDDNEYTWTFGSNGSVTFPDDTVQTTAYTGNPFDQDLNTDSSVQFSGVNTPSINNTVANEGLTLSATWETTTPNQELTGNDNQGGVTNDLISVWVSGSDPVFPDIVNVQAGWTVNGTGLEDGVVTDAELLDLGSGLVIYRMTIDTASEKNGYTYTFTEPPTVETGVRSWAFGADGALTMPSTGSIEQANSYTRTVNPSSISTGVATVVWSGISDDISSVKLLIQVEADEVGDLTGWHTQSCEAIIASRGYANGVSGFGDPVMTVYGIVHTSTLPLVTFTVQRNATTRVIEVVGRTTAAAAGNASIKVHSIEMVTRD